MIFEASWKPLKVVTRCPNKDSMVRITDSLSFGRMGMISTGVLERAEEGSMRRAKEL